MKLLKNKRSGFTLLELLIVIGIIGFISTISIFSLRTWSDTKYLDKTVVGFKNLVKGARAEAIASNKRFKFTFSNISNGLEISYYEEEYPSGLTNCSEGNWKVNNTFSGQNIKNKGKVIALVCENNNCSNKLSEVCFNPSGSANHRIIEFQLNNDNNKKRKLEIYAATGYLEVSKYINGDWKVE